MTAALAQLRRARGEVHGILADRSGAAAQGRGHVVRIQLAGPGKPAVQAAAHRIVRSQQPPYLLLRERLPVLDDENLPGDAGQGADQPLGQRILRDLQEGCSLRK